MMAATTAMTMVDKQQRWPSTEMVVVALETMTVGTVMMMVARK